MSDRPSAENDALANRSESDVHVSHNAENDARLRHQCGECGRYVPEASVAAYTDHESGVVDATGTCSRCGVVDVFRVFPPGRGNDAAIRCS